MKTCSTCKVPLPHDQFNRDRTKPDGLCTSCRNCAAEKGRAWHARNSERVRERHAARYAANAENERAKSAAWRASHPEAKKKADAAYSKRTAGRKAERQQRVVDVLGDTYIKQLLTENRRLKFSDVPQALVNLKREHLRLARALKEAEGHEDC